ncbi:MAG: Gfo/Idh/MocA family oxidoreductase [Chthoniobacteraceae bacterium]
MNPNSFRTSRRSFIKGLAVTSAGGIIFPNLLLRADDTPAGRKLGVAAIGCGGKGASDLEGSSKENEVVALCDVDANNLAKAAAKFPNAKTYTDFRKMLDEVKSIEAVTVSTPDHAHFPAAMHAIALGKHVCVQKPLVNTLWEARELHLAAKKKGVITQMGNQGHTYDDNRVVKEWIAAGVIGKVKEVHVWTNRPIWPQGNSVSFKSGEIPANLDWQQWLAATPDHAYSPDIHPFKWRGFLEWGAGAFGDMGCHLIDAPSWSLDLGVPKFITATKVDDITDIAWPTGAIVKMEFPNVKGHGDVTLTWYEGKKPDGTQYMPELPAAIDQVEAFANKDPKKDGKMPIGGWFIVGSEGVIFNPGDQAKNPQIWPKARREAVMANPPAKTLERSPKAGAPQEEWTLAIKNGKPFPFMSQFDYSVPLTELTLVGGLAMRMAGKRLEWNSGKLEVVGMPEAAKFIKRAAYRKGWEYSSAKV